MSNRIYGMLAAVAFAAACHGSGPATDPNTGMMGTPGMYMRATEPPAPSGAARRPACDTKAAGVAICLSVSNR